MSTTTGALTVQDFRELPDPTDGTYHELHNGELVRVTIPKLRHQIRQKRIEKVVERAAGDRGVVIMEFGFRALPEHEARRADVAFISMARYRAALDADEFFGAPDLVIEVLSPSNTAAEMDDKEKLCFANGCREFWQLDEDRQIVRVTRAEAPVRWYGAGETIEAGVLGVSVSVDELFSAL